jgi:hypothetical protein
VLHVVWRMVAAGAGGAALGAVGGFVVALVTLQARRWRNRRLTDRGEPAIRDAILPLPFVGLLAVVAFVAAVVLGAWWPAPRAALVGGLGPVALLALVALGGAAWQAMRE